MSLDLFEETDNVLANMRPVADPEPGVWDNFTAGTGKVAMQTFAKAGRAASMAAAPLAMAFEKAPGSTEVQDKFFKAHDEIFGRAVDYWTPKPGEVGEAGQVVGQLLGTLPMLFASPALTVAQTQLSVAEDMARKGVDAGTAQAIGATQAAGLGLGIWVPILGKTLAQRVLVGGAGFNVVQGGATRAISAQLAEGTAAEGDFKTFYPTALTLDVLLGAAFGGIAHINPRMRAEGEAWQKRLTEWGAKLKPSEVDALATLRQAQHLNADSMPGKPVDVADTNAHVDRMRQAIDDLANDRPVNVEDMPAPRFEVDAARAAEAKAAIKVMQDEARADGMVLEENVLPKVSPPETALPPAIEQSALKKANEVQGEKNAFDIAEEIRSLEEGGGVDLSGLFENPKYWDSENEQWTPEGLAAADAMTRQRAIDNLRLRDITELSDLNFANHKAQYAAMLEILDGLGVRYTDTSSAQSKYIEVGGHKLRFADHANQVRDSAVRGTLPVLNVAPGENTFTDALRVVIENTAPANSLELGSKAPEGAGMRERQAVRAGNADPLATSAARFAADNPDLPLFVGKNADGSDITTTPAKLLEDADAAMRQANDDVKLFEIAAGCLLGGGR